MGPHLKAEVERQLIEDIMHYGILDTRLRIDWSGACPEGHRTSYLDGDLEAVSNVSVLNGNNEIVAEGWLDFVHGGGDNQLFVFWLFLDIRRGGKWEEVKSEPVIPQHIWERLSDNTKDACMSEGKYDSNWCNDPLVISWKKLNNVR